MPCFWYLRCLVLGCFSLTLLACSSNNSDSDKPLIPRAASGYALFGCLENAQIDVYNVAAGLQQPSCSTRSNSDAEVYERAGAVSIEFSCVPDDAALYLLVASGGTDIDPQNLQQRLATPQSFSGHLHLLIKGEDLKRGNWAITPLSEVVYGKLRDALAAGTSYDIIFSEMDRYAAILVDDTTSDSVVDYQDVLHWRPYQTDKLLLRAETWAQVIQQIQNLDSERYQLIDTVAAKVVSTSELFGFGVLCDKAIEIKDDIAYIADGDGGLTLYDISGKFPELIANLDMFDPTFDIAVNDSVAALALGTEGFVLIDISPSDDGSITPKLVQKYAVNAVDVQHIVGSGDTLYIQNGKQVLIYDIADPDLAYDTGNTLDIPSQGDIRSMQVKGDRLYVASARYGTVYIFDISTPAQPTQLGTIDAGYGVDAFVVSDNYIFVMNDQDTHSKLYIYGLNDTTTALGSITTEKFDFQMRVSSDENYLYFDGSEQIHIIDVRDKTKPIRRADFQVSESSGFDNGGPPVNIPDLNLSYAIAIHDDLLLVAREKQLDEYRLSATPDLRLLENQTSLNYAYNVDVAAGEVYVADNSGAAFFSENSAGSLTFENESFPSSTYDVQAVGDVLYVAGWGVEALVDIADRQNPVTIDSNTYTPLPFHSGMSETAGPNQSYFVKRFLLNGTTLFYNSNEGLLSIDVGNPAQPLAHSAVRYTDAVDWNDTCVANSLNCVNVVSSYALKDFTLIDGQAYTITKTLLSRIDISDPQNLAILDTDLMPPPQFEWAVPTLEAVTADENYVYVAADATAAYLSKSVYIFDQRTHDYIGRFPLTDSIPLGRVLTMATYGDILLIVHTNIIRALEMSDPSEPALLWRIDSAFPNGIQVYNDKLYLADGFAGIKVYSLRNTPLPD